MPCAIVRSDLRDTPARHAEAASTLARQANRVLGAAGVEPSIGTRNLDGLARLMAGLGQADRMSRSG